MVSLVTCSSLSVDAEAEVTETLVPGLPSVGCAKVVEEGGLVGASADEG